MLKVYVIIRFSSSIVQFKLAPEQNIRRFKARATVIDRVKAPL